MASDLAFVPMPASVVTLVQKSWASVVGKDGKPMKMVEGKLGNRQWIDAQAAEAALVGQLADDAYEPRKVLTAPAAAKKLDDENDFPNERQPVADRGGEIGFKLWQREMYQFPPPRVAIDE